MMRVVLADDEQPARGRLESFLQDYDELELIGEATDGEEAVQRVNELKPDVLFLDIQMPKGNGFEVIKQLKHTPIVIFITAYDEYAIEAFKVHALDYLLKPFSKERFSSTVEHIKKILKAPEEYQNRTFSALREIASGEDYLDRISVKDSHSYSIIPVKEIQCIKTSEGLVYIQLLDENFQTDTSLNQFEKRLDPLFFLRIHRTAIVNLDKIVKIQPWGQGRFAAVLENGTSLQISREKLQSFKTKVGLKF